MAYDLQEQESLEQLKAWWEKWGNLTTTVITVGCLAFAGMNGWKWYQNREGMKATTAYVQLQNAYVRGDAKNIASLSDGLMKEYSRHVFASLAALMKASRAAADGKTEEARSALTWVLEKGGQPQYEVVARVRLAGLDLDAKKPEAALKVLEDAKSGRETVAYLDRLGDAYAALGRTADARKVWEQALAADADNQSLTALIGLKLSALKD